jgi:ACS family allantoate permease-like MFS transporter
MIVLVADHPRWDCSFFSILIQSFGYSATQSLLYNAPSGAIVFLFVISCLYFGDRYHHRIAFAMFAISVSAVAVLLVWLLPVGNKIGRLVASYLCVVCVICVRNSG